MSRFLNKIKTMPRWKKVLSASALLLAVSVLLVFIFRESLLAAYGRWLFVESRLEKSDVLVVLRGDDNYRRTLQAALLFKQGFGRRIYVPQSLRDKNAAIFERRQVRLESEQERILSILVQMGVPREKIIRGLRQPGGGTMGESRRVRAMMMEKEFDSAIIVTNWWHTRRARAIYSNTFKDSGMDITVTHVINDISHPSDWWKYRYEAIYIMEEGLKLWLFYFRSIFGLSFRDDPGHYNTSPNV